MDPKAESPIIHKLQGRDDLNLSVSPGQGTRYPPLRGQNWVRREGGELASFGKVWRSGTVLLAILVVILSVSCYQGESTPQGTVSPSPTGLAVSSLFTEPNVTPIPTATNPGLAYGTPCKPPCWQGLIPGETTREETVRVLQELRTSGGADEIADYFGPPDGTLTVFRHTEILADIYFENGIIESIDGRIQFDYTVRDLIGVVGPPEWIDDWIPGSPGPGKCSSCPESDASTKTGPLVQLSLLYPQQGLVFRTIAPASWQGCLCPQMRVYLFCYYVPQTVEDRLQNRQGPCAGHILARTLLDLTKWHEYGGGY